ncbi:MAG TPA: hypothetical protein VFC03_22980 [Acidimicrobiales bacterium]|nr:hypothetical protein [Acidimicrobiales bacterium]
MDWPGPLSGVPLSRVDVGASSRSAAAATLADHGCSGTLGGGSRESREYGEHPAGPYRRSRQGHDGLYRPRGPSAGHRCPRASHPGDGATTIAAAQAESATRQSVVPVATGETLTELQALEGLLVAQGNDMATLLTDWDAGSTAAFVAKMNASAHTLGLDSTKFTDPSGLDPGSVSTPADMIRLGEAAMSIPAFAQVVAMPQATLPLAGLVYNFDYDLGHDGIVGVKTGSDSTAGGCFLFESQETVGGKDVTLVGAVFGQEGASPVTTALDGADALVHAAFATVGTFPALLAPGHPVGRIVAPWAPSVPVTAESSSIVGWPGLTVPLQVHVGALPSAIPAGAQIGVLRADLGGRHTDLALRTSQPLHGPSAFWRITRW